jgi:hypothetical protein
MRQVDLNRKNIDGVFSREIHHHWMIDLAIIEHLKRLKILRRRLHAGSTPALGAM